MNVLIKIRFIDITSTNYRNFFCIFYTFTWSFIVTMHSNLSIVVVNFNPTVTAVFTETSGVNLSGGGNKKNVYLPSTIFAVV